MSQIPRLYVTAALSEGALVSLEEAQAHYVRHVLRMSEGEPVHLFNGRDGEWESRIENLGKRGAQLHCARQLRPQEPGPDLWLLFAPIKHGKIDFLAQKAVELGASRLSPVITQHTAVSRVNTERLLANAVEAAEQSGCMDVAHVDEPASLMSALQGWEEDRVLLYADESGQGLPPAEALPALRGRKLALLIGPEGGFSLPEHAHLRTLAFAKGFGLGPRILRADTAALAALAVIQAFCGDWNKRPHFTPAG